MLIQLTFILSLLAFVSARDLGDEVCKKVCKSTSKCIRKLDDDNNMICKDIKEFAQVNCTLVCDRRQPSESVSDHLGEDMYSEADQYFDTNENLLNSIMNSSHPKSWSLIKDTAQNTGVNGLSSLLLDLVTDAYGLLPENNLGHNHISKRSLPQNNRRKRFVACGPYGCHGYLGPYPGYPLGHPFGPYRGLGPYPAGYGPYGPRVVYYKK